MTIAPHEKTAQIIDCRMYDWSLISLCLSQACLGKFNRRKVGSHRNDRMKGRKEDSITERGLEHEGDPHRDRQAAPTVACRANDFPSTFPQLLPSLSRACLGKLIGLLMNGSKTRVFPHRRSVRLSRSPSQATALGWTAAACTSASSCCA